MKNIFLFTLFSFISLFVFSQANENSNDQYKKYHVIIITKDGEFKSAIKSGAQISVKVDGKSIDGRWFFKNYPDVVVVKNKKGDIVAEVELNKQNLLRIVTPEPKSGVGIGIGIGPISVSSMGPSYQSFNMEKHKAEIIEQMETKEEKIRREYYEKQEQERLDKEAAKAAKKAAKKNK